MCICWLVACENYGLLEAVDLVQTRRHSHGMQRATLLDSGTFYGNQLALASHDLGGTILSNHGFRLQLLRLALRLNRLGRAVSLQPAVPGTNGSQLKSIINEKRMTVQYDAKDSGGFRRQTSPFQQLRPRKLSLISEEVQHKVNQRSLKAARGEKMLIRL